MMYCLLVCRVVKHSTGNTAKFAPRSSNREELHWSGPFLGAKAAQRALVAVMATHTCLGASLWSADQIAEELRRLECTADYLKRDQFRLAARILAAALPATVEPSSP